jgi:hypothetical protein
MVLMVVSIQHSHELGRLEERTRTLAEEVALLHMRMELRDAVPETVEATQETR